MTLDFTAEFTALVSESTKKLLTSQVTIITYPEKDPPSSFDSNKSGLTSLLSGKANIYALWTRKEESNEWQLMYIGQRKSSQIRSRLIQHFFKKAEKTGSQLNQIKALVLAGHQVGVTVIFVSPDELRTSVEERLIKVMKGKGKCPWNVHS